MSTFLKLCQDVTRECGVAGGADASPKPLSVVGQTGELNRIVHWVADAYLEIQNGQNWRWLRKKFTVDTVAGTDTYAFGDCTDVDDASVITRFKSWRLDDQRNPPKIYLTSTGLGGQVLLTWAPWDNFEYLYKTGSLQSQTSQPVHITVNPKDEIQLGITPNDIYTLIGDYHKSAQILALDADIPEMPTAYHDLIKYQAMEFYGLFESAPEIVSRAQNGMKRLRNQLKRNQDPQYRIAGPMA
tara:strand:+ start:35889 stop:36614 length:726 start_codon:yes stop_codon:yes gene_type:complete